MVASILPSDQASDGVTADPGEPLNANRLEAWRRKNRDLFLLDNWHGPLAVFRQWAVIGVVAWVAENQQLVPWLAFYLLVALPLIATRMRGLATILHEGAHRTLAANPRLNRWLATYASSYLVLQTFWAYWLSHVRDHHGRHNRLGRDPDLDANVEGGLYAETSRTLFILRFLIGPFTLVRHPRMWRNLVRARLTAARISDHLSNREKTVALATRKELLGVAITNVAFVALISTLLGGRVLFLYWLIPLLYGFPIANWLCELSEHFPFPLTRKGDRLWHTRHRAVGPLSRHYFSILNEGYHWLHHELPGIPHWKLPEAMRRLRRDFPEVAQMVEQQGAGFWRPFGLSRQLLAAIDESTKLARKEGVS